MEYTEIFERIYASDNDSNKLSVEELDHFDKLAWQIIRFMGGRKGFDFWWSGIDAETQDEIFSGLRRTIFMGL